MLSRGIGPLVDQPLNVLIASGKALLDEEEGRSAVLLALVACCGQQDHGKHSGAGSHDDKCSWMRMFRVRRRSRCGGSPNRSASRHRRPIERLPEGHGRISVPPIVLREGAGGLERAGEGDPVDLLRGGDLASDQSRAVFRWVSAW